MKAMEGRIFSGLVEIRFTVTCWPCTLLGLCLAIVKVNFVNRLQLPGNLRFVNLPFVDVTRYLLHSCFHLSRAYSIHLTRIRTFRCTSSTHTLYLLFCTTFGKVAYQPDKVSKTGFGPLASQS